MCGPLYHVSWVEVYRVPFCFAVVERVVTALIDTLLLFLQGCYELVTSFMETNMAIIAGVTFGIAFSQVGERERESERERLRERDMWKPL